MANTVNVNFKLDADVKKKMELACADMGLSMSAAFTIFAKKVGNERRIPFDVSAPNDTEEDDLFSESNMKHLLSVIERVKNGTAKLEEHDLIEVD